MTEFTSTVESEIHQKLASELFNFTWDLIEQAERTEIEDETMIHAAHASRFHWGIAGIPLNYARGEWQISRVYSLVGRHEPALYHAQKCLVLCSDNDIGGLDLGFAYEAVARAYAVQGDIRQRDAHIASAMQCAQRVIEGSDRQWLLENISSVE